MIQKNIFLVLEYEDYAEKTQVLNAVQTLYKIKMLSSLHAQHILNKIPGVEYIIK